MYKITKTFTKDQIATIIKEKVRADLQRQNHDFSLEEIEVTLPDFNDEGSYSENYATIEIEL